MNEHKVYLKMAISASGYSPDLSTRNGAVLVTRDGAILRSCNEGPPRIPLINGRGEPPLKYDYIEHAERRVIYQAAADGFQTRGARLYSLWYACPDCARAIICSGIREVVGLLALDVLTPPRWRDRVKLGKEMLAEAGVRTRLFTEPLGLPVRFDGSEITV